MYPWHVVKWTFINSWWAAQMTTCKTYSFLITHTKHWFSQVLLKGFHLFIKLNFIENIFTLSTELGMRNIWIHEQNFRTWGYYCPVFGGRSVILFYFIFQVISSQFCLFPMIHLQLPQQRPYLRLFPPALVIFLILRNVTIWTEVSWDTSLCFLPSFVSCTFSSPFPGNSLLVILETCHKAASPSGVVVLSHPHQNLIAPHTTCPITTVTALTSVFFFLTPLILSGST